MRPSPLLAGLVSALVLIAGCSGVPSTDIDVGASASSASSSSASQGTATISSTAGTVNSALPDSTGALDVSSFHLADFASPDGKVRCSLSQDGALCNFPSKMNTTGVPGSKKICPKTGLKVSGITLLGLMEYFCSVGGDSNPTLGGDSTNWWSSSGFGSKKVKGKKLAVLPSGKKLVYGAVVCQAADAAITCANPKAKLGFTISTDGIQKFHS